MISVVICSTDDARFEAVSASYAKAMGNHAFEIIRIHDARSLCEGYNRGLRQARGEFVVFSHDDVDLLGTGLGERIESHLCTFDVIGVAGTNALAGMGWAHSGLARARGVITRCRDGALDVHLFGVTGPQMGGIEALDGVWIAARTVVARHVAFDESTFDGWHGYDTDFTFRCHLSQYRVGVVADVPIVHFGRGKVDANWLRYAARFRDKHETSLRATSGIWIDVLMRVGNAAEALAAYDIGALRWQTERVHAGLDLAPAGEGNPPLR